MSACVQCFALTFMGFVVCRCASAFMLVFVCLRRLRLCVLLVSVVDLYTCMRIFGCNCVRAVLFLSACYFFCVVVLALVASAARK